MFHFLKINFIEYIISFSYYSFLLIFPPQVRLCCGGGSRVATRLTLAWMTCTLVPLVKKIAIETASVMAVYACVTMGFKVRRCKSY